MPPIEENIMVVLSSPSGVGKTTLTKKIQQKFPNFKISVSRPREYCGITLVQWYIEH